MVHEAEVHRAADQARREDIEARNEAEASIYQAERLIKDLGDKAPANLKTEVEGKVANVRVEMGGQDVDEIQRTTQELHGMLQSLATAAYQAAGGANGATGETPKGEPEGTVEGEFREM